MSITDSAVNLSSYTDIQLSAPPNPWSYNTSLILKVKPTGNCSTNKLVMLIRHEQASTMSNQPLSLSVVKDSTSTSVYNGSANIASIAYAMGYVTLNLTSTLTLNANEVYTFTFTVASGKYDYRFYEIPSGRAVYSNNDSAVASLQMINSSGTLVSTSSRVWIEIGDITSGGGGDGFDGGTINEPLEINCKFPYLADQPAVNSWMSSAPLNPSNYSAYLRFTNVNNPQHSTDMYGITFKDDTNTDVAAIGVNDSLLVRKNLFAQGYIRTVKSILRLEKSTPYTPPNAGALGNVNLGTATWPFDEIFTSYGHIGLLTVPKAIYTDWIEGFTPNKPLTIGASSGGNIKLDGDVLITGTLTGGGGGSGSWNGGEVYKPISIVDDFLHLYYFQNDANSQSDQRLSWSIHDWIYWYSHYNSPFAAKHRRLPPGAVEDDNIGLRLKEDRQGGWWTNIVGGRIIQDPANDPNGTPAVLMRNHLIVGRDLDARGMIKSYEGIIVLLGNSYGAKPPSDPEQVWDPDQGKYVTVYRTPPNNAYNIGWGPRVGTPFIWLAGGGDDTGYGQGGNTAAGTLLIVTNRVPPSPSAPPLYTLEDNKYKWGGLECGEFTAWTSAISKGDFICNGFVKTSHIQTDANTGNNVVAIHSSLYPYDLSAQPTGLDLGSSTELWEKLYAKNAYINVIQKATAAATGVKINSALLDSAGVAGTSGQVLTSQGAGLAPTWQTPSSGGGSGGVQKGSVTTDGNGVGTFAFPVGTFPSGYTPTIVCTAHDTSGRSITAVVTSSSNTGFTVKTFLVDSHKHKVGQVYNTTNQPLIIAKDGKHQHYAVGTTGTTSHRHSIPTQANHNHYAVGTTGVTSHRHGIPTQANHNHYAVGTTGVTSHRHGIPSQGDHSHGITNGSVGSYNTSSVVAGGTNHSHTYSSWAAATNTNNGGGHNHGGYTDNETSHAHTYSTTTSDSGSHDHGGNTDYESTHAHTYSTTTSDSGSHNHGGYTDNETSHAHTFATTTSGMGNTSQDAEAEHTHAFSQIPPYMRETVMYDQAGEQVHTGGAFTTILDNTQVTEIYTVSTVNKPISILVNWMAM